MDTMALAERIITYSWTLVLFIFGFLMYKLFSSVSNSSKLRKEQLKYYKSQNEKENHNNNG